MERTPTKVFICLSHMCWKPFTNLYFSRTRRRDDRERKDDRPYVYTTYLYYTGRISDSTFGTYLIPPLCCTSLVGTEDGDSCHGYDLIDMDLKKIPSFSVKGSNSLVILNPKRWWGTTWIRINYTTISKSRKTNSSLYDSVRGSPVLS